MNLIPRPRKLRSGARSQSGCHDSFWHLLSRSRKRRVSLSLGSILLVLLTFSACADPPRFTDSTIVLNEITRLQEGTIHNLKNVNDLRNSAKSHGRLNDAWVLVVLQGKFEVLSVHLAHLETLEKIFSVMEDSPEKLKTARFIAESYASAAVFFNDVPEIVVATEEMSPNLMEYVEKQVDGLKWVLEKFILPRGAELKSAQ